MSAAPLKPADVTVGVGRAAAGFRTQMSAAPLKPLDDVHFAGQDDHVSALR